MRFPSQSTRRDHPPDDAAKNPSIGRDLLQLRLDASRSFTFPKAAGFMGWRPVVRRL